MSVETADLRPGHRISRIVKGGWQLAGDHGEVRPEQAIADMEAFLDAGITTFDCADIYKGVEEMIGAFVADVRRRCGAAAADRVVVHTKLVPDLGRLDDIRPDEVEAIVDRSLQRLKIERLALVQFFWWDMSRGDPVGALAVLKDCQRKGKIATLGVTNWAEPAMDRFIDAGYDVASAQVQYSLLDRRPAGAFTRWCARRDVQILCYGTLAGGFLTEHWLGRSDPGYAFENRSLVKYRLIIEEFGGWARFQELLGVLDGIAAKHRVALASVAARFILDKPGVAVLLLGARNAAHLPEMLEVLKVRLDDADRTAIAALADTAPGPLGDCYDLERVEDGVHSRIMWKNQNTRGAGAR
jgi:aryl-alcohol dehydrogenase-like predicted oxidoreductase